MKNIFLLLIVYSMSILFLKAQTCATQNDTSVTITISFPVGISYTYFDFPFSPELSNVTYTIDNGIVGDDVNTTYNPGDDNNTTEFNTDIGYYVHLIDAQRIYIQKNPTGSGIFAVDDALTWTLTISGLSGNYEVTSLSATNGVSVSASPCNQAPTADSIVSSISTSTPLEASFEAINAEDDGTIANYLWDFGDSETGSGNPVTHLYETDGKYTVMLQLEDNYGALSDANLATPENDPFSDTIYTNQRPTLERINAIPNSGNILEVEFSVNTPTDPDEEDTIASYSWDFGDASVETRTDNTPITHTYSTEGIYNVSLYIVDDKGLTSLAHYREVDLSGETTVNAFETNQFIKLYPTAYNDFFTLELAGQNSELYEVFITDIYGRVVEKSRLESTNHFGEELLSGIYFVLVRNVEQRKVVFQSKIIKL